MICKAPQLSVSVLLLLLMLPSTHSSASSLDDSLERPATRLTQAESMIEIARQANQEERVILLLVSQEDCPYCILLKQDILGPMIKSGDFENQLLVRELMIDQGTDVVDFNGQIESGADFALHYGVGLTPTMLFLDAQGNELTTRMTGIQTPEMFYFYVERSIEEAISLLRQNARK